MKSLSEQVLSSIEFKSNVNSNLGSNHIKNENMSVYDMEEEIRHNLTSLGLEKEKVNTIMKSIAKDYKILIVEEVKKDVLKHLNDLDYFIKNLRK